MNKIKIYLLVFISLGIIGCSLMYSIVGSGDIIKEDRDIDSEFTGVKITNHGDLFIKIGDKVKLTLQGDDNIIPHILTEVEGDRLTISSDRKLRRGFKSRKGIKYFLTVKAGQLDSLTVTSHGDIVATELKGKKIKINLSSHGDVNIDTIKADELKLKLSSHGDIKIGNLEAESIICKQTSHSKVSIKSGKVKNQELIMTSHGDYLAKNLESSNCEVKITSHGKVVVNVKEILKARVTRHGDLYYRGNPELKINRSKGTIKSID